MGELVDVITSLLRPKLDEQGLSKQDALMALAACSAWIITREPHNPEDDLSIYLSPATELLIVSQKES